MCRAIEIAATKAQNLPSQIESLPTQIESQPAKAGFAIFLLRF
jgi:hypothetical protein